jgi:hypothetical protein
MMTVDYKTEREFLNREIAIWGYDEIDELLNRGFRVVLTPDGVTWASERDSETAKDRVSAKADLTNSSLCATLIFAVSSVSPVSGDAQSSRVSAFN